MSTTFVTPVPDQTNLLPVVNRVEKGILQRAVCIALEINSLGNRKKVPTNMIDVPLNGAKAAAPEPKPADGPNQEELFAVSVTQDPESGVWIGRYRDTTVTAEGETEDLAIRNTVAQFRAYEKSLSGEPAAGPPGVDKKMLGVSKMLLDSRELRAIKKLDGRIRKFVYDKCLPYKIGIHLLPYELVNVVEDQLKLYAAERQLLVEAFLRAYPTQIQLAGSRLLVLFNPADYNGIESVRASFSFDWQYISFDTPGKLAGISPELFRMEQEKAARRWEEASEAIQQVLREQMRALVEKLRDRLAPGPDGKPKSFRKEIVVNMQDFLAEFDVRNVASDGELTALVERARALVGNVDPDQLRTNETMRTELAASFSAMKLELDTMVVDSPVRRINFEEE